MKRRKKERNEMDKRKEVIKMEKKRVEKTKEAKEVKK